MSKNPRKAYFSPKNWLNQAAFGVNGKRYSQLPIQDYEVNEDGTITAYGGTYNISTDNQGRKYFDVLIPEYNTKTKTGPYLNRGFDHIDSSGRVIGRGETYNRYYVGNLIPIQKEEISQPVIEEPSQQISVAATVRPKVIRPKQVTVPAQYRQGLAKVENGETYYTFDGYSPEQIGLAITSIVSSKPRTANNYYIQDTSNTVQDTSSQTPLSFTRTNSTNNIKRPVANGNNDEGVFLYKYPGKNIHVYKVLPEVAAAIRKNLQDQPLTTESRFTRFTNVPLTNTPGGELNDSIFHDIFIPSNMDEDEYSVYHRDYLPEGVVDLSKNRYADDQIAMGQHSNDEQPIVLLSYNNVKTDNSNYIETGQGNLVFFKSPYEDGKVFAYTIVPSLKAKVKYFPAYKDNTGKQHMGTWVTDQGEIHYKHDKLSNYGIPVQSWEETSQLLKPQNTTAQAGTSFKEGLKNIGSSFASDFKSLFNRKHGGTINYIDFFKNGSKIHIKKKNRGKFTDYCGGKVTEECIQKGKHSSNPTTRKRATFAANARKWKHQSGGLIYFNRSKVNSEDNNVTQYLPEDNSLYYKADNTYVVNNKKPYTDTKSYTFDFTPITIAATEKKSDNKLHADINGLLDLFNKYNVRVRVTSGYREGAKTKQGKTSFHALGKAIDIVPEDGDFTKLAQAIKNNPEIKQYMLSKGLGVYDETTADVLALTGGTGKHYHIGPDQIAQKFWTT